uniref:Uncharacterized protein n=1 Tax=Romanomermis culicivorax TaxID=13658 RepID=A0A915JW00_ROMCU
MLPEIKSVEKMPAEERDFPGLLNVDHTSVQKCPKVQLLEAAIIALKIQTASGSSKKSRVDMSHM